MMKTILPLKNRIQHYPWGSPRTIPDLLGIENPDDLPFAELWMGAHPKAPSTAVTGGGEAPLNVLVTRDPDFFLGSRVQQAFGDRLPFLFKVLAAEKPLSIQAHPNLQQARDGFQDEERRGIPVDAPNRNYRDANHKPELICALTPFTALCGFRTPETIAANLGVFKTTRPLVDVLSSGGGCREVFERMLFLNDQQRRQILSEVRWYTRDRDDPVSRWVTRLAEEYPEDIGVLSPYILNLVELSPGQALSLKAGVLHSYLHGTGIELMANSDNVLRGGLTSKHVDRDELMKVLDFNPGTPRLLAGEAGGERFMEYPAGEQEFGLSVLRPEHSGNVRVSDDGGPEILLCTEGSWTVSTADESAGLSRGQSLFMAAAAGAYTVEGTGVLYRASVPSGTGA